MRYKWKLFAVIAFCIAMISTTVTGIYAFGFTEDQKDIMNLQTYNVSDFGDTEDALSNKNVIWKINPSRFAYQDEEKAKAGTDTSISNWWDTNHVKASYLFGKPLGLAERVEQDQNWTLGVKAKFIKKAYNWIEVIPMNVTNGGIYDGEYYDAVSRTNYKQPKDPQSESLLGTNMTLELKGIVKSLDVWIWGGNYNWWMEFHLRDFLGFMHRLSAGSIKHVGWKNLRTKIPSYIPQYESYAPFLRSLNLVMLKLWSYPTEQVRHFYTYFDYMQVQTDVYIQRYNGDNFGYKTNW